VVRRLVLVSTAPALFGVGCVESWGVVGVLWCVCWHLLGPEAARGVVSGVVFENCRVDASIFVVKLCRAHGGCLGIRSR
jgi:hypothetical protein